MNLQSLSSSHPLLLLLYCKTRIYCFPETLLEEEQLSVLFIGILAAIHSFFYVKRGGQLHSDEICSVVWFSASFCSTPMIISCLFYGKVLGFIHSLFYRERNQKNMGNRFLFFSSSKKADHVAFTGTVKVHISILTFSDWPRGLWLEYVGAVCKVHYSIMGDFLFFFLTLSNISLKAKHATAKVSDP